MQTRSAQARSSKSSGDIGRYRNCRDHENLLEFVAHEFQWTKMNAREGAAVRLVINALAGTQIEIRKSENCSTVHVD